MNKSESKYHNTALYMNEALIELLNKQSYEFITVKEICKKAGVNRSTFYLHYDTIADLLSETIENLDKEFFTCFPSEQRDVISKIRENKKENLIFINPEYLIPYLEHVKKHKVVYMVSAKYPTLMKSEEKYKFLQEKILFPIFNSFQINAAERKYFAAYYISGVYAIVNEWIKGGCQDDINKICDLIIKCVRPYLQ